MRNLLKGLLAFLLCVTFTACWDNRELTDIAFVVALGIDKGEHFPYRVTIQIVNPSNANSSQKLDSKESEVTHSYSEEGNNIFEANRRISKTLSRQLHYGHAMVLVVGEELAKTEGLYQLFDGVERDNEFRPSADFIIAKGTTAEDLLRVPAELDKIPAAKIKKLLQETEETWGENLDVKVNQVIRYLMSAGSEPVVTGFKIGRQGGYELLVADGMGLIRDGKLVHWLEDKYSRGVLWVKGKIKSTLINIDWKGQKNAVGIEIVRMYSKMSSRIVGGKPVIDVYIGAEGNVGELRVPINLSNPNLIFEMQRNLEKAILKEAQATIAAVQKESTDIFSFGEVVHRSQPKVWKQLKDNWNKVTFPRLEVHVKVEAYIRRMGLRNESILRDIHSGDQVPH